MNRFLRLLVLGIIVLINIQSVNATEIIVANSSELQNAINNVQGGDTISLLSGNYYDLTISGKNNNSFVTICAYTGATPVFTSIDIHNSTYWKLFGIDINPRYSSGADGTEAVNLDGNFQYFFCSCIIA